MSSNIDIISADISIFDDIAIFMMSFSKKQEVKIFFELDWTWFFYITYYAVTPLSDLAVNILEMLSA